jgi:hypothetical protein
MISHLRDSSQAEITASKAAVLVVVLVISGMSNSFSSLATPGPVHAGAGAFSFPWATTMAHLRLWGTFDPGDESWGMRGHATE